MDDCEMWTMNDDLAYTLRLVEEYKSAKDLADSSKKRADNLKKELSDLVDAEGYEGDNGHLWYEIGAVSYTHLTLQTNREV